MTYRTAKQLQTVFTTCVRMETSASMYIRRLRTNADGMTSSVPYRMQTAEFDAAAGLMITTALPP